MNTPYFIESTPRPMDAVYEFTVCRLVDTAHPDTRRWLLNIYKDGNNASCLCFGMKMPLYEEDLGREKVINQMLAWLMTTVFPTKSPTWNDTFTQMLTYLNDAFEELDRMEAQALGEQDTNVDDDWDPSMMGGEPDINSDAYVADGLYVNAKSQLIEK